MTFERLYNYYLKHKKPYDKLNRPDYASKRVFIDSPVPESLILANTKVFDIEGEIIRPKEFLTSKRISQVVLFIHGGSFTSGDKASVRTASCFIADRANVTVYNTNYSLAPERPYPSALDDCYAVYLNLLSQYSSSNIIVVGESAGATLALCLCNRAKKNNVSLPKGLILLSPAVQFVEDLESHTKNYDSDCMVSNFLEEIQCEYFQTDKLAELTKPEASPIYGDFTHFPPTLIFVSDNEVLYDHSILLEKKLKECNVQVELEIASNLMHVYPLFVNIKEGKTAMLKAISFINRLFD